VEGITLVELQKEKGSNKRKRPLFRRSQRSSAGLRVVTSKCAKKSLSNLPRVKRSRRKKRDTVVQKREKLERGGVFPTRNSHLFAKGKKKARDEKKKSPVPNCPLLKEGKPASQGKKGRQHIHRGRGNRRVSLKK